MRLSKLLVSTSAAVAGMVVVVGSIALASQDRQQQQQQEEMQLPPGWTQEDMQNVMKAATPGKNHEYLTAGAGTWEGKTTMWMYPDAEPIESTATAKVTPIMGGRFVMVEWSGEMPGMGGYEGLGIYGYDNTTQQFVATSVDNMGTMIAQAEGELSPDGKTLVWEYTYNCPVTHKPTSMREVQTRSSPNEMKLEMHGKEPKSGKEFRMMVIELKRTDSNARTR